MVSERVTTRFGGLPYLFKVLDVKDMLSYRYIPLKKKWKRSPVKTQRAFPWMPLTGTIGWQPQEVMVALSEFWLLHGFKKRAAGRNPAQWAFVPSFAAPVWKRRLLRLYKHVMELAAKRTPRSTIQKNSHIPTSCQSRSRLLGMQGNRRSTACRARQGIFSIYFSISSTCTPGSIFQGRAYRMPIWGQNIELMSNPDNVLRGGLTPKHIDVPDYSGIRFLSIAPALWTENKATKQFIIARSVLL